MKNILNNFVRMLNTRYLFKIIYTHNVEVIIILKVKFINNSTPIQPNINHEKIIKIH